MNRVYSIIAVLLASWCTLQIANAQYANPILTNSVDARASAMGRVALSARTQPLYSVLGTQLRTAESPLSIGYSMSMTPLKGANGRQYFHALSAGYRLSGRHIVLAGARYWGGLELEYYNAVGARRGLIHPKDWTLDLGYAYAWSNRLAVSVGMSYLNTYSSQMSQSIMGHLALTYSGRLETMDTDYALDLSLRNLGTRMYFGKDKHSSSSLPTYVQLGGLMTRSILPDQKLSVATSIVYHTTREANGAISIGGGLEYDLERIVALRLGGIYEQDNSMLTLGLGRKFGSWSLDLAYSLGSYSQFNLLNMSIAVSL